MSRASKYRDGRCNNRPPIEHQFKPGQSGNPNGRPMRPPPSFVELLAKELNAWHTVEINGGAERVQSKQILVRRAVQLAMKGNYKLLLWLLEIVDKMQETEIKRLSDQHEWGDQKAIQEKLRTMSKEERSRLYLKAIREVGGGD